MIIVVSYGGGTNSTALLVGMRDRQITPDLILFADTGGEKPTTYEHVRTVSRWCESVGFPPIITVQSQNRAGEYYTLEQRCLDNQMLPSIAYGFKACSEKHKRRPQDKYVAHWPLAKELWKSGGKVTKFIGFDADEAHRAKIADDNRYTYRYPLIEWDWGRDECIEAIASAGLSQPGKSACFFCPSSKKKEVIELARNHPDLFARAAAMEANANIHTIKGLGRNYSWRELVMSNADAVPESGITVDCGCYDGE